MERHVIASNLSRQFKTTAIVLLAVYALLVLLAAACPLGSTFDSHHQAHTHHHSSAHTILCDWSCQLSSSPLFISLYDHILPSLILIGIATVLTERLLTTADILPETRGPPVCLSQV
jgi:hypothetical protein